MTRTARAWRNRGFIGPRYAGVLGRIRFLWQHLFVRRDVVLAALAAAARPGVEEPKGLVLRWVRSWEEFAPLSASVEAEYGSGFVAGWRRAFGWGEILGVGMIDGRIAGFGWVQRGTVTGTRCPYTVLWETDCRIVRVGVMPSSRGRGVNTRFYALALDSLFEDGARRVIIDCAVDNIPSLKAQLRAGFVPIGALVVFGEAFGGAVAWRPIRSADLPQL